MLYELCAQELGQFKICLQFANSADTLVIKE